MTSCYVRKLEEAFEIIENSRASQIRYSSYGTVIYVPATTSNEVVPNEHEKKDSSNLLESNAIDFGTGVASDKKNLCPRVLLITTWSDAKFGFVGTSL